MLMIKPSHDPVDRNTAKVADQDFQKSNIKYEPLLFVVFTTSYNRNPKFWGLNIPRQKTFCDI